MDNIYCDGTEEEIALCRFDGWGKHDCTSTEAAGVICDKPEEFAVDEPLHAETVKNSM